MTNKQKTPTAKVFSVHGALQATPMTSLERSAILRPGLKGTF